MLTLYEQYRKACPNSILTEQQISEVEMLRHIKQFDENYRYRNANRVEEPSEEEKAKYAQWNEERQYNSFNDFSIHKQMEVRKAVEEYQTQFGTVETIHLSGSYASGSWFDDETPADEIEIRKAIKSCDHPSDIDLIPHPFLAPATIGMVDFTKVPKGRKVLIYQNGEFV